VLLIYQLPVVIYITARSDRTNDPSVDSKLGAARGDDHAITRGDLTPDRVAVV